MAVLKTIVNFARYRKMNAALASSPCLGDLRVGARARIDALAPDLGRDLRLRLLELGLLPGTAVQVVRVAPMGDPIEVRVRGYALSIRRAEARSVRVREVSVPEAGAMPELQGAVAE
jgi:ferrous iron transport protein A